MDFSILIASLSLLLAGLAELRSTRKDKSEAHTSELAISLFQLLKCLDRIILVGENILLNLANAYKRGVLSTRYRIAELVKEQSHNLKIYSEIFETPINLVNGKIPVTLGDYIELHVPDKTHVVNKKNHYIRVLSWKLLKKRATFNQVKVAICQALGILIKKTKVVEKKQVGIIKETGIKVKTPKKVAIGLDLSVEQRGEKFEAKEIDTVVYELDKPEDILKAIENGNQQIEELRNLRELLAKFLRESFSINDLVS